MVLARAIYLVGVSSGLEEAEQVVCSSASEPLKSHIIGIGRFRGHGANGKDMGGAVVSGDWCGLCLWVAHILECGVVRHGALAPIVDGSCFCLWC